MLAAAGAAALARRAFDERVTGGVRAVELQVLLAVALPGQPAGGFPR